MSKNYAVIGDPINHSLSPIIHNAAFRELGLDCTYIGYRIKKDELDAGIESLKKIGIAGFNVTIPHKVEMMKYLDRMDESCSFVGAVNTVANIDGILKGYNTDIEGFLEPLKKRRVEFKELNVLLIGSGGAARAVVGGLAKENVKNLTIANRTPENANMLAKFSIKIGLETEIIKLEQINSVQKKFDLIVNATSIGLENEQSPILFENIKPKVIVYDIVYKPILTDFLKKAKEKGAEIIYGYEMLLGQAIRAFEVWQNRKAPYEVMKRALLGGM